MSKSTKKKEEKPKKERGEKKEIVFDLSDGVSWHDFAGLFILFFVFIWKIIRLILAPFFWVYGENVRMFRFIRATAHERVMTEDERVFVESMPLIFTLTGAVGGVIIGILAAISFQEDIDSFLDDLNTDFMDAIFDAIATLLGWIWDALVWIVKAFISLFSWIVEFAADIFSLNPFLAFIGLATFGIIILLLWITLHEKGVFDSVFGALSRFLYWIIGSPDRFRFKITNYYRKVNHWLTAFLIGEKTLLTRTQIYFKRVTLYTVVTSVYSFGAGIYIGTRPEDFGGDNFTESNGLQIVFTAVVLFFAGFVSGTILFGVLARFLDLMNRKKYIAPEFIKADGIDQDKITQVVEKDKAERKEAEEKAKAEKPWKKRKEPESTTTEEKPTE